MIDNSPIWIDIDCVGEKTGERYHGRFSIKRYLTHKERSDVSRLADTYTRGIIEDVAQKGLLYVLAQLAFHVVESDAPWWKASDNGLDLHDEEPIISLMVAIQEQQGGKKKEEAKSDSSEKEEKSDKSGK